MSISAIAANQPPLDPSAAASGGLAGSLQLLANNYNTLGQSLASGDLSGAQQAYASLIQTATGAGGATTGATPSPTSIDASSGSSGTSAGGSVGTDLAALGKALQSGNLAGAQQAFATLNQAIQSVGHGHGAHGGGKDASGGEASSGSGGASGSSSASASTVTNQVTTTNADGSLSVTTTYADGTTSTKIEPNPHPTQTTNKLDPSNAGQLLALLGAQEQSRSG